MAKRYEVIKHVQQECWFDNSPLLLSAHALIKDTVSDAVCAQCKFTNLSQMEIDAVYISIACTGADGNAVEGVGQYVYLDLKTRAGEFLGDDKLIPLPDNTTRQFTVALNKVVFSDGSNWQADERKYFASIPASMPLSKLAGLEEQYRRIAPEESQANLPERHDTYWRCGCGQINLTQTTNCIKCGHSLKSQLAAVDTNTLEAQLADYTAQEKENERLEAERIAETARIAEEKRRAEAERREVALQNGRRKKKKILMVSLPILVICVITAASYAVWLNGDPHKYDVAVSLFEAGDYENAEKAFSQLDDFKDSAERLLDARNHVPYNNALALLNAGEYEKAVIAFAELGNYKDSPERLAVCKAKLTEIIEAQNVSLYNQAKDWLNAGEYGKAAIAFGKLGDFQDSVASFEKSKNEWVLTNRFAPIAGGSRHTVGLKIDGTVVAAGSREHNRCDVLDWSNIVAIAAGNVHTVGLKSDGTVIAVGNNNYGQCDVADWSDIVAIATGVFHTVALKSDGTVVATGLNDKGQCEVSIWSDIIAIAAAGEGHTVGLKSDGTVVTVGDNEYGQCDTSDWSNIVAIAAGRGHTVGLMSDKIVVAVGSNAWEACNVSQWSSLNIVDVATGEAYTVGLKFDGTVIAVGDNWQGRCDVSDWGDIVAITTGSAHTIGLKSDGTVVAVGWNEYGQCDVSAWADIRTK